MHHERLNECQTSNCAFSFVAVVSDARTRICLEMGKEQRKKTTFNKKATSAWSGGRSCDDVSQVTDGISGFKNTGMFLMCAFSNPTRETGVTCYLNAALQVLFSTDAAKRMSEHK
jgi:hypothetical protein